MLAALLLLARPLVVSACTLPDRRARWTPQEILFLCWTRETGVVPAALVGVLAGLGVPNIEIYASVVALAVVLTLVLQALPAAGSPPGWGCSTGPRSSRRRRWPRSRLELRTAAGSGRSPIG